MMGRGGVIARLTNHVPHTRDLPYVSRPVIRYVQDIPAVIKQLKAVGADMKKITAQPCQKELKAGKSKTTQVMLYC